MSDTATIKINKISKTYKNRTVVNKVEFSIKQGEIIGLLGPNGAGKSTCFYMVLGLVSCDTGTIFLNNLDITAKPVHERAKLGIGYLPQEPSVFRKLSVADNILAIIETDNISREKQYEKLDRLLNEFNLNHIRNSMGLSLSGGERRRVEIARCLAKDPKFILLDEPFAGVDPISIIDIKNIIKYLANKGIGIIITDHNVRETLEICEKAYIMNSGNVIASGNSDEILSNEKVKKVYLGEGFKL